MPYSPVLDELFLGIFLGSMDQPRRLITFCKNRE